MCSRNQGNNRSVWTRLNVVASVRARVCGPPPAVWLASLCQSGHPPFTPWRIPWIFSWRSPSRKAGGHWWDATPTWSSSAWRRSDATLWCHRKHRCLSPTAHQEQRQRQRQAKTYRIVLNWQWLLQLSTVIWLNRVCTFQRTKMTSARMSRPMRTLRMMIQIGIPPEVSFVTWIFTCS